jgi:type IV pilus assembly protein PilC
MIIMLTFVMPMFADIFSASTLPLPTRIMLGASNALRNYWFIFIAATAAFFYGFNAFKRSKEGLRFYDNAILNLPVVGKLMSTIITASFTRTLSTLLSSGVSIIKALESATEITNNVVVMKDMAGVINNVKKGVALSALLKRVKTFPPMMVSMLSIGEETGAIDDMLSKTADFYDDELEVSLGKLVSLLEPLMIVVMGVGIGGIVIAMYLPMFDMFNNIQL